MNAIEEKLEQIAQTYKEANEANMETMGTVAKLVGFRIGVIEKVIMEQLALLKQDIAIMQSVQPIAQNEALDKPEPPVLQQ